MKRPSFQFYPGDWLRDAALRSCSVGARGLWIDMMCLMHDGTPYGHLRVGGKVIHPDNLARMLGATLRDVEGWLQELRDAQVYSKDSSGAMYSRRMIRDEQIRLSRAAGGIKGGNPMLKNPAQKVNLHANLELTPSSSSSVHSPTEREEGTGGSEILSLEQVKAAVMTSGIPDGFVGMVYSSWIKRGGRDGCGVPVDITEYVRGRWTSNEGVDWQSGNHRGLPRVNGKHGPATKKDPSVWEATKLIEAKQVRMAELKAEGTEELDDGNWRWLRGYESQRAEYKRLEAEVIELKRKLEGVKA